MESKPVVRYTAVRVKPQVEGIMGRNDVSVSIRQRIATESVDHLTAGVLSIVDLKRVSSGAEKPLSSIPYVIMSNA